MAMEIIAYSRLIEENETRTLASIRTNRLKVVGPLIADERGRVIKMTPNGTIVEFGSVVDAVACAVALQEWMNVDQRDAPPDGRIVFRIGINIGDVVVEDGDLSGDGINIAVQLELLAEPGGFCIADSVYEQLSGNSDLVFEDAGEHTLQDIPQPVRFWRWSRTTAFLSEPVRT